MIGRVSKRVTVSRIAFEIAIADLDEEHAFAAVAVERLDDHLAALFGHEFSQPRDAS